LQEYIATECSDFQALCFIIL